MPAREGLLAGQAYDGAHAVVGAGAAGGAHAQPARVQVHVVIDDDEILGLDLVPVHQLDDGLAREVHVGLRRGEHHTLPADGALPHQRLAAQLGDGDVQLGAQHAQHVKAHVVAGVLVFFIGIAKAHDDIHYSLPSALRVSTQPERLR